MVIRARKRTAALLRGALATAVVAATLAAAGGAQAGPLAVQVLAPRDGAELQAGAATVIGKSFAGPGATIEVTVNGKAVRGGSTGPGGAFQFPVYLVAGKNVVRISVAGNHMVMTVAAGDRGAYRYHPEVQKCDTCHDNGGKGYVVPSPKEGVCYKCHDRKDGGKHVHGPLGGGDCTACHDPHGSENRGMTLAREESLCVSCHDQRSSESHVKKSRGKACTSCHDPHSTAKAFLQK